MANGRLGRCIFCDQVRFLTEEDLISKWIDKTMRARTGGKVDVVFSTRQTYGDVVRPLGHRRVQTYSAIKLSEVCADCNSGWMSQIDKAASEVLRPMILGRRTGLPVRDQVVVARWLALKTLIVDLIDHGYPTFEPEDYHAFYADRNPPDRFRAAVAHIDTKGKDDHYFTIAPLTAAKAINGVKVGDPIAMEFFFSAGPVYFHTTLANAEGRRYADPMKLKVNPYWTVVWPSRTGEVNWPPPLRFTPEMLPDAQGKWDDATEWISEHVRKKSG